MYKSSEKRLLTLLAGYDASIFRSGQNGVEKESLRVTPNGDIAQTPHPPALGSALTHPSITTDYSEALLELITAPLPDVRDTLESLSRIHGFVYRNIGDEMLWATSMPCALKGDESIPIAYYGTSNIGMMKHVYRRGLAYRYGRSMQAIAGVHFNHSFGPAFWHALQDATGDRRDASTFISDSYFRLIRNFQRFGWIIPYLFGASPALCKSFLHGANAGFREFDKYTYYEPFGTSLRMSDIGYKNKSQAGLYICYNNLETYVRSLGKAMATEDPEYAAIGTLIDGEWRQLNPNVLQIENEYYSFVRPKQPIERGEKPTHALRERGVQYVEIRALDVNAYHPLGVNETELRFIEALLLLCVLEQSAPIEPDEQQKINRNQAAVARHGRNPDLELERNGGSVPLRTWAAELCSAMEGICEALDGTAADRPYGRALGAQVEAVRDADRTPSARILAEMRETGEPFSEFAMRLSMQHARHFRELPIDTETEKHFREMANASLAEQARLEATPAIPFDEYLREYFAEP